MVTSGQQPPGTTIPADAEEAGEGGAVESIHGGLDRAVGEEREPGRAGADLAPEGGGHIGVEGAVGLDLPAHGDKSDREDHNDDADNQIGAGSAGAVAERGGQGDAPTIPVSGAWADKTKNRMPMTPTLPARSAVECSLRGAGFCGPGLGI